MWDHLASNQHAEALRSRGYTVIPSVMTDAEIDQARVALDGIFRREERVGLYRGWHNGVYRVAYMLPQKHALFRSFCEREALLSLVRAVLGPTCVLGSLNGLSMTPGGTDQRLHIDQEESVPGTVLCINALHTLDDFTRENGCTRVVPGSHDRVWSDDAAAVDLAESDALYLEAPAGSLIAYSGGLWHAGSRNRTNRHRRAVHAFFAREWMRPHWDFRRSLSPGVIGTLTPEQRRLFGFSAAPRRYDRWSDQVFKGDVTWGARIARWRSIARRLRLPD